MKHTGVVELEQELFTANLAPKETALQSSQAFAAICILLAHIGCIKLAEVIGGTNPYTCLCRKV